MLRIVGEHYIISTNARLLYNRKIDFIRQLTAEVCKKASANETLEQDYWDELNLDLLDLKEEDAEFHRDQLEEYLVNHKTLAQIQFYYLFTSIYSVIEVFLFELVTEVEQKKGNKIKLKNLRKDGSDIQHYFNFLNLVYNIEIKNSSEFLKSLKGFADIRNCIIHKNGNLLIEERNRKDRITKAINILEGLEIDEDKIYFVDDRYIKEFISFANKLGLQLFSDIKLMVK